MRDVAYQALLPLFAYNIKSWERGPRDEAKDGMHEHYNIILNAIYSASANTRLHVRKPRERVEFER